MCCSTKEMHASHGCSCGMGSSPALWSKKKKLDVLSHRLECLKEQENEIKQAIDELNGNK